MNLYTRSMRVILLSFLSMGLTQRCFSETDQRVKTLPGNLALTLYQIKTDHCSIELKTKKGASVYVGNWNRGAVNLSVPFERDKYHLSFQLKCIHANADKYCSTAWAQSTLDDDSQLLPYLKIRQYDGSHPLYYSRVYASSMTAVSEPRARVVSFCVGDVNHTLDGYVVAGTEVEDHTPEVLRIFKTIRFIEWNDSAPHK